MSICVEWEGYCILVFACLRVIVSECVCVCLRLSCQAPSVHAPCAPVRDILRVRALRPCGGGRRAGLQVPASRAALRRRNRSGSGGAWRRAEPDCGTLPAAPAARSCRCLTIRPRPGILPAPPPWGIPTPWSGPRAFALEPAMNARSRHERR